MSWDIFKQNILRVANNPDGISDIDSIAKLYATEYDAAIKRGSDTLNHISVKEGNIEAMQSLFKAALLKGQSSTTPYDLVGEMGKGVIAYWQGAVLNQFPIPIIPAPGSTANTGITSAICTNGGQWQPAVSIPSLANGNPYDKLDWSKIQGLDKNDPEVQRIINPPNPNTMKEEVEIKFVSEENIDNASASDTQLDNVKAEILDRALRDQNLIEDLPVSDSDLKSGYNSLDELLRKAGAWARKLGKNLRVKYENLKMGYVHGIHGLCPQGAQSVVAALTGIRELGSITGNADWFSFKRPGTDGGNASFAINVGGKVYYNDKVRVDSSYTTNPSKWQVGDIVAMGYTSESGKRYGHIQVWTGWNWVSDFTQRAIQANNVDSSTIALWRLNENGRKAVEQNKNKSI